MNILVIAPTPYFSDRGCHIRILGELQVLKNAGHTPVVYTYHLGRDVGGCQTYRTPRIPWYTKTEAGPSWQKPFIDMLLLWKIFRTYKRHRFDSIHAHLHEGACIGWLARFFVRRPLLVDLQGSLAGELDAHGFFTIPGSRQLWTWLEHAIVKKADRITVSSQAGYDGILQHMPDLAERLSVLPDAAPAPLQNADYAEINTRPMPALTPEAPVVVYSGGLQKVKGFDLFVDAIPLIVSAVPNAQFLIIGYPDTERWKARTAQLGVFDHVYFTGGVPFELLSGYLELADIAVDPKPAGAQESSGKMVQYMIAGCPVVAFESVNNRAMLDGTGILVKTETAKALAEGVIHLLQNIALRNRLSAESKQRGLSMTWVRQSQLLLSLYERITRP